MARNTQPTQSLVAAATRVRLNAPEARQDLGRRQAWQVEAWQRWRTVPEIKQAMLFLGAAFSKLRLYVAADDPDDAEADPLPVDDPAAKISPALALAAKEELARLEASEGGIPELLRRLDLNWEIPGEAFLVGYGARAVGDLDPRPGKGLGKLLAVELAEEWSIRSTSQVHYDESSPQGARIVIRATAGSNEGRALDPEVDTIIRIHQADPEWPDLSDSAMQGVLGECRILQALTNQQLKIANSQMHAGVMTLPNELSFAPMPAQPGDGQEGDGGEGENPFIVELDRSFTEPVDEPDSLSTVRPMLIQGPAQYLTPEFLRYFGLTGELDTTVDQRIEVRVRRIARGLNVPVEVIEGMSESTYANASQVNQDTYEDYLDPRCRAIVGALTFGYLRPNLDDRDEAFDPAELARVKVWFDPKNLFRQPDPQKASDYGVEHILIRDESWRRENGYSESDAPDALETLIALAMRKGTFAGKITAAMIEALAAEAGVELPAVSDAVPAVDDAGASMQVLALALALRDRQRSPVEGGPPGPFVLAAAAALTRPAPREPSDAGARLVAIDQELRTRLEVAANDAMERVLEKAGNRLRSKAGADKPTLADTPARMVASTLGRTRVAASADPADLIGDGWDALERQFMEWVGVAQGDALAVVSRVVGGLSTAGRAAVALRQADDVAAAWGWMREALDGLALERLFDPDPNVPEVGEFDPTLSVPAGLVRRALSRAGGAQALTASALSSGQAGEAWVTLTDGGTRPAGGVATGDAMRDVLRDHGAQVEAYRWVYGPAQRRAFKPHLRLSGTVFRNFDDAVLANSAGWPPFEFYMPGDHSGCRCDAEPIIVPPDQVAGYVPPPVEPAPLTRRQLRDASQGWLDDASEGQREAVNLYTGGRYHNVNRGLRTGTLRQADRQIADDLDGLLSRAPAVSQDMSVYRGVSRMSDLYGTLSDAIDSGQAVGMRITDKGFVSTTLSEAKAKRWAKGGVTMEIRLQAGQRVGGYVEQVSQFKEEQEFLLRRGRTYVVREARSLRGGRLHFVLEVV